MPLAKHETSEQLVGDRLDGPVQVVSLAEAGHSVLAMNTKQQEIRLRPQRIVSIRAMFIADHHFR